MSKKVCSIVTVSLFLVFIFGFFIVNLIVPSKDFSEMENRTLAQRPAFSFSSLFSGEFMSDFESYVTDQFAGRDGWISLKSYAELALGKKENNGVYLCEGETLIERFDEPDYTVVDRNITAVNTLAENAGVPVYLSIIPGAAKIWDYKMPEGAPNCDQLELIDYIYKKSQANNVDIYSALEPHKDEYIFYRTDHHWTTLGAYYGYCAVAEKMGLQPVPLENYEADEVTDSFYGTVYSSSGMRWVSPDTITTYVPEEGVTVTNYSDGTAHEGKLYDYSYLEKKDKYSMFYGGNTPLLTIDTGNADLPNLLILRDSYMDSESPYFFAHFSNIHIIDLRYYKMSIQEYIQENNIDCVLVSYSADNFSSDSNVFLAGR